MNNLNVYGGLTAINDFLNPENHLTPLVELPSSLNPFLADGIHIYIKMQTFLPLMNVKSVPAYEMLKNDVQPKRRLAESSSGNMAFSLSVLSRCFGYEKTRAVISHETNREKVQMLLLSGTEIWVNKEPICPDPHSDESGIRIAEKTAHRSSWKNLNQYANPDNPGGHYEFCGQQILKQLNNDIRIFCTSLGTTGSLCGIARALKKKTEARCIGVARKPNNPVPGPRTLNLLKMIDFDWQQQTDDVVEEGTVHAYDQSMRLCRAGILAGPSTGLALAGLLKYLRREKLKNDFAGLKNGRPEINCVILACDLPFLYLDEYFKYLPRKRFPKIFHQELLSARIDFQKPRRPQTEISASGTIKLVFGCGAASLQHRLNDGEKSETNAKAIIIDIRNKELFAGGHIPCSINIEENTLLKTMDERSEQMQDKQIVLVCDYGEKAYFYARILRDKGYDCRSLRGGLVRWSELNYPRISATCTLGR